MIVSLQGSFDRSTPVHGSPEVAIPEINDYR